MNVTGCIVADDTDSDGRIEGAADPATKPATQAPKSDTKPATQPATASKLKPETVAEITDIFEAMNLPQQIRAGRMKWAESVGDAKALEKMRADCKAHRENKGGK